MAILSTLESTACRMHFKMVHFNIKTQNLDLVNLKCHGNSRTTHSSFQRTFFFNILICFLQCSFKRALFKTFNNIENWIVVTDLSLVYCHSNYVKYCKIRITYIHDRTIFSITSPCTVFSFFLPFLSLSYMWPFLPYLLLTYQYCSHIVYVFN